MATLEQLIDQLRNADSAEARSRAADALAAKHGSEEIAVRALVEALEDPGLVDTGEQIGWSSQSYFINVSIEMAHALSRCGPLAHSILLSILRAGGEGRARVLKHADELPGPFLVPILVEATRTEPIAEDLWKALEVSNLKVIKEYSPRDRTAQLSALLRAIEVSTRADAPGAVGKLIEHAIQHWQEYLPFIQAAWADGALESWCLANSPESPVTLLIRASRPAGAPVGLLASQVAKGSEVERRLFIRALTAASRAVARHVLLSHESLWNWACDLMKHLPLGSLDNRTNYQLAAVLAGDVDIGRRLAEGRHDLGPWLVEAFVENARESPALASALVAQLAGGLEALPPGRAEPCIRGLVGIAQFRPELVLAQLEGWIRPNPLPSWGWAAVRVATLVGPPAVSLLERLSVLQLELVERPLAAGERARERAEQLKGVTKAIAAIQLSK